MNKDYQQKLKEIIIKFSKIKLKADEIDDNTNLIHDLGFDSIRLIQMVSEIEKEFDFVFSHKDMDYDSFINFKKLSICIQDKIS